MDSVAVLKSLASTREGLSSVIAHERLVRYGNNEMPREQTPWWLFLVRQYTGVFSYALLAIALFYFFTKSYAESLLVFTIYVINGLLAFWQEYRSDRAAQILQRYLEHSAHVIREGIEITIPASRVVPGDILVVRAGDLICADVRIIELNRTWFDESVMTGESLPVEKTATALSSQPTNMYDARSIAYAGTQVTQGMMIGVVIATGSSTTLGAMGMRARSVVRVSTFAQEMPRLIRFIGILLIVSLFIIFSVNLFVRGASVNDMWHLAIIAIALVVAAIPEALPLVITSSLAQGAVRLATHGAVIVKRLSAVEDLGHMQILCCDKTGTLTEHKLSVASIFADNQDEVLVMARLGGAPISTKANQLHGFDTPIQESLTPALLQELSYYRRVNEFPFDASTQVTVVVVVKNDVCTVITLGVPETLLALTPSLSQAQRDTFLQDTLAAGQRGERVIGVAIRLVGEGQEPVVDAAQPHTRFIGVISFHDPIKKTAMSAITTAKKLKVAIKVISGDSAQVCAYVAHQLGLITSHDQVMTGDAWDALNEQDRAAALQTHHIFARCVPLQKAAIVRALKTTGACVGYVGDGVNDILPLKEAHVAIAVQNAPDVVYESADIILVHKSLLNIVNGIATGRVTVHNIITYLRITLATSFSNLYSISAAALFIIFPDVFPLHMLVVNLLSDLPLIAIATDNVDAHTLTLPQRFDRVAMLHSTVILGLLNSCMDALFLWCFYTISADVLETSWVLWSTLSEVGIIFSLRTTLSAFRATRPSWQLLTLSSVTTIIAIALPFSNIGRHSLGYSALSVYQVMVIIMLVVLYFILSELIKPLVFCRSHDKSSPA